MSQAQLRKPHPHSVDLLRNRNPNVPLGPFDSKVGAFVKLGAQEFFVTTNTDYVPETPSLETPHRVYPRTDMRYGTDDPVLWPQQYEPFYCHMPLVARKGARPELEVMWWNPSPADFVVGSAITRGLGRLKPARVIKLLEPVDGLIAQVRALLEASTDRTLHPLFGELIQHILNWAEQLQTLPMTFPQMIFALTSMQRAFLELDALYLYITVYKKRIADYFAGGPFPVAKTMGAFVTDANVALQLGNAGIPYWYLRDVVRFAEENILKVVTLREPNFGLDDPDAPAPTAPTPLYTGNSTREKIHAIKKAAIHMQWYCDPFASTTTRPRSPSPPPVPSGSHLVARPPSPSTSTLPVAGNSHLVARPKDRQQTRSKPYPAGAPRKREEKSGKVKGPAKVERDKFVVFAAEEMPPTIVCMADALAKVDRQVTPYDSVDKRYVLPEPALFANTSPERRRKFLHHWNLLSDGFLYMLTQGTPQPFSAQEWRDVLEGLLTKHGHPNSRSFKHKYDRNGDLEDHIRLALQASEISSLSSVTDFPVPDRLVPQFSLAQTREIIWRVAETSFRFEFSALDKRASGLDRFDRVTHCWRGRMLVGVPLEMSKRGWASTELEERHVYVKRTAELMLTWTTKSPLPNIIRRVIETASWTPGEMRDLEDAVCRYYTQAFWEYFGRAAVVPMRLDHDLEKEEGEL